MLMIIAHIINPNIDTDDRITLCITILFSLYIPIPHFVSTCKMMNLE
jgi:hypothetical protein